MTTAPAIVDPRRAWLKAKSGMITASDVPKILGVSPFGSKFTVFAEKAGGVQMADSDHLAWGRAFEAPIAERYGELTGRAVRCPDPYAIVIHPDIPWLGATLDRETRASEENPAPVAGGPEWVPLELKAVGEYGAREEWEQDVPLHYQGQVQIQMACARTTWAPIAAFVGMSKPPAWRDLVRSDDFLTAALPHLEQFLWHVRNRIPPQPDASPETTAAIKELWPVSDGSRITLDELAMATVMEWERAQKQCQRARALVKKREERAREFENLLRVRMGAAEYGYLPDGTGLTLETTTARGYSVGPKQYRALKRWRPKGLRRAK